MSLRRLFRWENLLPRRGAAQLVLKSLIKTVEGETEIYYLGVASEVIVPDTLLVEEVIASKDWIIVK